MIIEEYDENLFISRFEDYKRVVTPENKNGNFSYKGLRALFQYLEDLYTEEKDFQSQGTERKSSCTWKKVFQAQERH